MALQVWLPLNGNLNNQGLTDITVTDGGATVNNNGKIGKCYYFDGTDDYINLGNLNNFFDGSPFTICFWIKSLENATRGVIFSSYALPSGSNFFCIEVNSSTVTNNSLRFDWNSNPDTHAAAGSIPYNEWVHIAIVYNGTNATQIYKNGSLINTLTMTLTSLSSTNNFYLGRDARTGATALNGYLNDFRIYDNALSPREIEILSRGLVCHYPLNGGGRGGDNLLLKTNQGKTYWAWGCASGSRTAEDYETTGVKLSVETAGSGWNMWYYSGLVPSDIEPDTDYTVSVDILPPQNATIKCSIMQTNATNVICPASDCTVTANVWNHAVFKLHSNSSFTSSNQVIYMNGIAPDTVGKTIYLKNLKLEKGTTATPWMPNPADSAYTAMGYNSTTEYDVSGYGNNGTKNGTFAYDSNTARYSVCSSFNGTSAYIESDPLPTETATIACWLKTTWTSSSGYRLAVHDKNSGLAIGWSGTRLITYIGSSAGSTGSIIETDGKWTANAWHHVTVVKTGSTTRDVYIDGVKMATSGGNWWGGDLNKLNIGNRHVSGSYSAYWDGQISDFRAYATALSATQVAELYNTAVSVANNGTLMGYELVEG